MILIKLENGAEIPCDLFLEVEGEDIVARSKALGFIFRTQIGAEVDILDIAYEGIKFFFETYINKQGEGALNHWLDNRGIKHP